MCLCPRQINYRFRTTGATSPGNAAVEKKKKNGCKSLLLSNKAQKILTRNFRATMFGMLPEDLLLPAGLVDCSV